MKLLKLLVVIANLMLMVGCNNGTVTPLTAVPQATPTSEVVGRLICSLPPMARLKFGGTAGRAITPPP